MKNKIYEFDMVIYPYPLLVTKLVDGKEIMDRFYRVKDSHTLVDFEDDDVKLAGTVVARTCIVVDKIKNRMCFLVLLSSDKLSVGTMTHEAGHVSTFLGAWLGFQTRNPENDEPYAYIDEFVTDCIYQTCRHHPEKMNGQLLE